MIGLFLDDEREPEDVTWVSYPDDIEWYVFRRMNDLLFAVMNMGGEQYQISFDHDIQDYDTFGNENTGYTCLKNVINYCLDTGKTIPVCYFHTKNPIGLKNMLTYYDNAIKHS